MVRKSSFAYFLLIVFILYILLSYYFIFTERSLIQI